MLAERSKPDKGLRVIDGEKGARNTRAAESGTMEAGGEPQSGDRIAGKYEIRRMIAQGGVGIVFLAHRFGGDDDDATPRDVVIKLLAKRWLADADAVARFEREANRLRSLEHPNVVSMLDYGVDNGRPYLVMEYIEGESLADYLSSRGSLSLREFVPIAAQVLKGMGHAHSRKMMIRDVKPSNIMLCQRKGRANFVKILDFGLAKFLEDEVPLTEGYVLGTAGYLAPEALRGQTLDLRVDVYSIGVLFYHLLSGDLPFEAESTETIFYKTLNEKPNDLRGRLPAGHDVPEGLVQLIERCLEKQPEARPEDANIVVEQLIDVVPAALFRLPLIGARGPGGTPLGSGNTGLIQLVGANPSIQRPLPVAIEGGSTRRVRLAAWGAAYGLTLLVAGLVVYASVFRQNAEGVNQTNDAATTVASSVAETTKSDPEVIPGAAGVQALEASPTVQEKAGSKSDSIQSVVFLASFPEAQVIVNGIDRGMTPFKDPLEVGSHTVVMRAPGYKDWTSTITVTDDDFEPISVYLERNRTTSSRSRGSSHAREVPFVPPPPPAEANGGVAKRVESAPEPDVEDPRASASGASDRSSVFLSAQPPKKKVRSNKASLLTPSSP